LSGEITQGLAYQLAGTLAAMSFYCKLLGR
jgi:hypothetical protein